jgi:uncharacterized protein YjhX (UPF0386 family)
MLDKCETLALHQGKRIAYRKDKSYALLSYDCLSTYWTGTDLDKLFAYLKGTSDGK